MDRKNRRYPFISDMNDWFDIDLENIMNEMDAMMRSNLEDHEDFQGKPVYYGYSVKIGPDGIPHIKEWGNARSGREQLDTKACSCPAPDVGHVTNSTSSAQTVPDAEGEEGEGPYTCSMFDDNKNELKIHADIPGISKSDIELELRDNKLILNARTENRYYHKEIPIDHEIESKDIKANYNNGVLEITLKCKKEVKDKKAEKIKID